MLPKANDIYQIRNPHIVVDCCLNIHKDIIYSLSVGVRFGVFSANNAKSNTNHPYMHVVSFKEIFFAYF